MSGGSRWRGDVLRGADYDRRFERLAASGHDVHGEARLVASLGVRSVLDAGCGTGRVAVELARRGLDVVGVDLDPAMLEQARTKAPDLTWVLGDLTAVDLGRTFDAVVLAGNVLLFVAEGTEGAVVANLARHLEPGGFLVAGFSLAPHGLSLPAYDELASAAGLGLRRRFATWEEASFEEGGDYAVSVHVLRPAHL
ncbi:MAG TPA: class I SAM-dependent methyltransferase [Acidimicrobiales bacterium]|nr:class I SAM-dependent methyltransferase [Acidimicrobiales bacterium]HLN16079.1 class I SAM-dependent methyltransferase [Acidimicrobiales bacterium]